ncbi:D-alanyl-D-alanine carboxypeptidase [Streptomyces sp. NPDC045431]|uniref:D-alanyl-D-alanine carboxypeptidase family protein n=1 Tax=Streptomyces sp. NPDC045431 TaxID=3155613 RepID=UPI0033EBF8E8
MAGESPDKSEQRKPSGETASGARDPRVQMRGDGTVVDQPTAVFKTLPRAATVPRPDDAADDGSDDGSDDASKEPVEAEGAKESDEAKESEASGDARLKAAVEAWVSRDADADADAEGDGAEGSTSDGEQEEAEAEDAADEADADEPDESDDSDTGDEGDKGAETAAAAVAASAAAADAAVAKKSVPAPAPAEKDKKDEGDEAVDDSAPAPVDQPTAVFKAVPRKAVDQPTTALKAVAPKSGSAPAPAPAAPEAAAERTSKFVPLRPDMKEPGAPATSAPKPAPKQQDKQDKQDKPKVAAPVSASAAAPAALTEAERTKQQPLPPRPPLDLLAELTNTPPPPPTPVRTLIRRVKIWTPLVALLLIVFAIVQAVRPLPAPTLTLAAPATYTFEGGQLTMPWPGEGQGAVEVDGVGMIGTYGANKPGPIASVAKTMTAYVILKEHPITGKQTGPKIKVDAIAARESSNEDESRVHVKEGDEYTQKQMLQMLMIPSANNIARQLARWDSSQEEFVKKMNAAAKELGMTNTHYTDPSGLDRTTVSTAVDQIKLGKAAMENDVFREIVNSPNATVPGTVGRMENNNNILLEPGVSGIKTGSSTPAGGNLLWAANAEVDGELRRIVGAVMGVQKGSTPDQKLQESIKLSLKLIQTAQDGITSATIVKKGDVVGHVDDGLGGRTPVVATKDLKPVGWPGLKVDLKLVRGDAPLPHSAKEGTVVGELSVGEGTGKVAVPVALERDLVEPGFDDKLVRLG